MVIVQFSQQQQEGYFIKEEMDRLKELTCDDMDLKKQIGLSNTMPDHVKKAAMSKLDEMKNK